MTTATRTPSVCPGTGRLAVIYGGKLNGYPAARCLICKRIVQVYEKDSHRFIATHERREQ